MAWLIQNSSKTGTGSSSQLLANVAFLTEIVAVMFVCKLLSLQCNILSLASGKQPAKRAKKRISCALPAVQYRQNGGPKIRAY